MSVSQGGLPASNYRKDVTPSHTHTHTHTHLSGWGSVRVWEVDRECGDGVRVPVVFAVLSIFLRDPLSQS